MYIWTHSSNVYKYIHSRETQRQGSIQQQEPYSIYTQMIIRRASSALPTVQGDSIVFLLLWTSSTTVIFIFFFSYYSFFKCVLMLIIGFWKRISHQYRERKKERGWASIIIISLHNMILNPERRWRRSSWPVEGWVNIVSVYTKY